MYIFNENILEQFLSDDTQLIGVHNLIYCTAVFISEELNFKITEYTTNTRLITKENHPGNKDQFLLPG